MNVVDVGCLPAWLIGRVVPRAVRRPWYPFSVGLAGLCGVAIVQAGAAGRWPTAVVLAGFAVALLGGPVAAARWRAARARVEASAVADLDPAAGAFPMLPR